MSSAVSGAIQVVKVRPGNLGYPVLAMRRFLFPVLFLPMLFYAGIGCSSESASQAPVDPRVMAALQTESYVEVIVFVGSFLGAPGRVAQDDVLGSIDDTEFILSSRLATVGLIGLVSADGVEVLIRHPLVSEIQLRE